MPPGAEHALAKKQPRPFPSQTYRLFPKHETYIFHMTLWPGFSIANIRNKRVESTQKCEVHNWMCGRNI